MLLFVIAVPAAISLLFWTTSRKKVLHTINIIGALLLLIFTFVIITGVASKGRMVFPSDGSLLYVDSLSAIVLVTILLVGFMTMVYSVGYLETELSRGVIDIKKVRLFYSLTYAFIFTMILAVTTPNIGVLWIAIEATTLASAFLVGFYNNKESIEAAWKYIIICSVGIALALLGIVLLYLSTPAFWGDNKGLAFNWYYLFNHASQLKSGALKMSFIFILVGFGTKAGFVPMHTWLPDAHSQAPSPVSALLSGVLLNSAMYGIIRMLSIVNKNLGETLFTGRLLMASGILSIAAAALFILSQKDYKRLLAYSSIEHMGIMAFGLGIFSPAAIFGVLFHMLNHAITKSMLFLSSGNVYLKYETRQISKVRGLLRTMPVTGLVFMFGIFAIAGLPPFGVFFSELKIVLAAFKSDYTVLAIIFVLLLAAVFAVIAIILLEMFYHDGTGTNDELPKGEVNRVGVAVTVLMLVIITVTGLFMPEPLIKILTNAASIITGGV
jgi:hydrogenase-4 component F